MSYLESRKCLHCGSTMTIIVDPMQSRPQPKLYCSRHCEQRAKLGAMSIEEMLEAVCEPIGDMHEVDMFHEMIRRYKLMEHELSLCKHFRTGTPRTSKEDMLTDVNAAYAMIRNVAMLMDMHAFYESAGKDRKLLCRAIHARDKFVV